MVISEHHDRAGFEALTGAGAEDTAARALAQRLKANPQASDLKALAALWLHAAVAAPERTPGLYDATAWGWLGEPVAKPGAARPVAPKRPPPQNRSRRRSGPRCGACSTNRAAVWARPASPSVPRRWPGWSPPACRRGSARRRWPIPASRPPSPGAIRRSSP